jgi:hypothetical protein
MLCTPCIAIAAMRRGGSAALLSRPGVYQIEKDRNRWRPGERYRGRLTTAGHGVGG